MFETTGNALLDEPLEPGMDSPPEESVVLTEDAIDYVRCVPFDFVLLFFNANVSFNNRYQPRKRFRYSRQLPIRGGNRPRYPRAQIPSKKR